MAVFWRPRANTSERVSKSMRVRSTRPGPSSGMTKGVASTDSWRSCSTSDMTDVMSGLSVSERMPLGETNDDRHEGLGVGGGGVG